MAKHRPRKRRDIPGPRRMAPASTAFWLVAPFLFWRSAGRLRRQDARLSRFQGAASLNRSARRSLAYHGRRAEPDLGPKPVEAQPERARRRSAV